MEFFTTSAAIGNLVDKKVLVVLQDGQNLHGNLRAYDEFAHLVLEDTVEYIYRGRTYGSIWRGLFVIQAENVVLLGEIDMDVDEAPKKILLEYHVLERARKKDRKMSDSKNES
ncbi:hypothetical protein C8R45DRAFT_1093126 [Mycena sanguinolenta]|nr:hypothetical protein C8R45DRAFT_1093126 [Mycena sanguinolenta]